ncbi:MAG: transporter substrate-binding domain-containing protein [Shinella sp.]|nr:transporter substrate-binding domain-containing protein [Shinella sp.]
MRRSVVSSLKFYGFLLLSVFHFALHAGLASAQDSRTAGGFPILFDTRERIAKPDLSGMVRLRFLTTVDFPPFNFIDQNGKLSGFHVDLVREICSELGITAKCQLQAVTFPELQDALKDGNGEAVVAGVAVTTELRKEFGFSRPFLRLPARFAVLRKSAFPAESAAALAGKPVGVVAGTVHEAMIKAFFPDIKAVALPGRSETLAALKDGKVDAVFADGMQLAFWISGSDSAACCRLFDGPYFSERFLGEGLTIMSRKGEPEIVTAMDHALLALSRNGKLAEIYLRYFPNGLF